MRHANSVSLNMTSTYNRRQMTPAEHEAIIRQTKMADDAMAANQCPNCGRQLSSQEGTLSCAVDGFYIRVALPIMISRRPGFYRRPVYARNYRSE